MVTIDDLKRILSKMRYVSTGDLILAADHNSLVNYAEVATLLMENHEGRLAAVEETLRTQPPYPPASGIDPYTAIADNPDIRAIYSYNMGSRDPYVITDDYPAHIMVRDKDTTWLYVAFSSSRRVGKSTTFALLDDYRMYDTAMVSLKAQVAFRGDFTYGFIIAMLRLREHNIVGTMGQVMNVIGCYEAGTTYPILVDENKVIHVTGSDGVTINTGITLDDWKIIAVGVYPGPGTNTRIVIADANANTLFLRDDNMLNPRCTRGFEAYFADIEDPTTTPPTGITLEYDWETIYSYAYSLI